MSMNLIVNPRGDLVYIYRKKGCVCSYNILFSEPIAVILLLDESLLGGAPGQSWPGPRRRRSEIRTPFADILVCVEAAERRSRPVQDPTANPAPADPAETRAAHPAGLPAWPRSQRRCHITQAAITANQPREFGIRDEDGQRKTSCERRPRAHNQDSAPGHAGGRLRAHRLRSGRDQHPQLIVAALATMAACREPLRRSVQTVLVRRYGSSLTRGDR
jgi:hypothetical protein